MKLPYEHIMEQLEASVAECDGHTGMEILKRGLGIGAPRAAELLVLFERTPDVARLRIAHEHFLA